MRALLLNSRVVGPLIVFSCLVVFVSFLRTSKSSSDNLVVYVNEKPPDGDTVLQDVKQSRISEPSTTGGPVKSTELKRRLPQALVIGIRKCGTGTFRDFTDLSPHIHWQIPRDELLVFSKPKFSLEEFRKKMPKTAAGDVTIVKSPGYITDSAAIPRIKTYNSSIRLISMMRDPVTRLISHYVEMKSTTNGPEKNRSFDSFVLKANGEVNPSYSHFNLGRYYNHLVKWYKEFPKEQILLIDGDAFIEDPYPILKQAEEFLRVPSFIKREHLVFDEDKGFYCKVVDGEKQCQPKIKGRPHPNVTEEVIQKLRDYYRPFDKKLVELTGQKFSWMDF